MSSPDAPIKTRASTLGRKATLIIVIVGVLSACWLLTRPQPKRLFSRGLSLTSRDPAAAELLFRGAIAAAGGRYPDAQVGLCAALARQGDWDEAQRLFAELDPSTCRADVLLAFGREALDADHITAAEQALGEAGRRGAWESQPALELLLTGYRQRGLQNELLAVGRQLTRIQPDRFDIWAILVEALRGMKLDQECLETASEALDHDPPEDYRREFQFAILEVSIARGDAARGTAELARLRALEGNSFRARVCAVSLYRLQGRLDEALKAAANLFAESGQQTTAHLIRGYIWLDLGENEKAVGDLQLVVAQQPLNTQAHFKLSEALRALGQPAEALAHSKIANALWAKRMLINSLLKQRAADPGNDALVADQLARLFEEVGDENSAAHWKREAAAAAQKRVRPDR